ncbi:MAG: hypothetical protein VCB99_00875 [Myxococcota bacterium]
MGSFAGWVWALSMGNLVLKLSPEILVPTHFHVIRGKDYIRSSVTVMRDAVQYMWDETIRGMNEGKTVWQLMEEIQLPPELELSQGHGKVSWSVRAAWELLVGWYNYESVANLYQRPARNYRNPRGPWRSNLRSRGVRDPLRPGRGSRAPA